MPPIPRALDDFLDFVIIFAIVYQACQLKPKLSVLYLRNKYDQTVYWRVRKIKISSKCPNAVLCHPNWESSCRTANIARQMCSTDEPVTGCKEYLSLHGKSIWILSPVERQRLHCPYMHGNTAFPHGCHAC